MESIWKGRLNLQNIKTKKLHAGTTLNTTCNNELMGAEKSYTPSTDSESSGRRRIVNRGYGGRGAGHGGNLEGRDAVYT